MPSSLWWPTRRSRKHASWTLSEARAPPVAPYTESRSRTKTFTTRKASAQLPAPKSWPTSCRNTTPPSSASWKQLTWCCSEKSVSTSLPAGTNDNPHYGAVHNPWDLARIPVGSSGGLGAALAAPFCLADTGGDTGGSVPTPPPLGGLNGLDTTYRRARWLRGGALARVPLPPQPQAHP